MRQFFLLGVYDCEVCKATPASYMPPFCRYGLDCRSKDCTFRHPLGKRAAEKAPEDIPCKYGVDCFRSTCHFSHPASWVVCAVGDACPYSDCKCSHPPRRPSCNSGVLCKLMDCHFLHPRSWHARCSKNECPEGADCLFSDCPKSHPHRPEPCTYGAKCLRGKDECRYIHPEAWYSQEVVRDSCQHGDACSREDCRFAHPASRVLCPDGGNCRYSDCSATAHPKRRPLCKNGTDCEREDCHFLHPRSWYGEHCPFGKKCLYSDCKKKHPVRPRVCRDGMKCSRAKQACGHLHPREWYGECKMFLVDPSKVRFTHGHIHHKFRFGNGLDDTIDQLRHEELSFDDFPPMEVFRLTRATLDDEVVIESILSSLDIPSRSSQAYKFIKQLRESCTGELFSLSNRRLFVARVGHNFGLLDKVLVQEYDFASERVQRPERGEDDGDEKAKWLSALCQLRTWVDLCIVIAHTVGLKCMGMCRILSNCPKPFPMRQDRPCAGLFGPRFRRRPDKRGCQAGCTRSKSLMMPSTCAFSSLHCRR